MNDPHVQQRIRELLAHTDYSQDEVDREAEALRAQDQRYTKGAKLAQDLSNMVNSMAHDDEIRGFIDELNQRTHRTLQQSAFGVVMRWIYSLADIPDRWTDLRNKHTVETARKIKELLGPYGAGTPLI